MSPLYLLIAIFGAMSVAMLIGWAYQRARANGGWPQRLVRRFCHWILVKKAGE
jgi:hypothetical protein